MGARKCSRKFTGTAVGIVLGVGGLTTLFVGPAMGAVADRLGHWRTLIVGAAVAVVLWPLPALARNLVSFAITWALLNGAASGALRSRSASLRARLRMTCADA